MIRSLRTLAARAMINGDRKMEAALDRVLKALLHRYSYIRINI